MPATSWLASDPSKRWAERFVLWYSPLLILAVAIVQFGGILGRWGDLACMVFGVALALPLVVVPLAWPAEAALALPWYERHWVKLNIWVGIFTWSGSYFVSHYFF